jgi:hypothetical protein
MADLERYTRYYLEQAGNGMNVFRGSRYQRGHGGIGSFLKGLLRMAMPLFKSGARAVGREALRTGANILGDISSNKPAKQVFKDRLKEAGHALHARAEAGISRMAGNGRLKGVKRRCKIQSGGEAKRIRTSVKRKRDRNIVKKKKRKIVKKKKKKKKSVRTLRDIFS